MEAARRFESQSRARSESGSVGAGRRRQHDLCPVRYFSLKVAVFFDSQSRRREQIREHTHTDTQSTYNKSALCTAS